MWTFLMGAQRKLGHSRRQNNRSMWSLESSFGRHVWTLHKSTVVLFYYIYLLFTIY